VYKIDKLPEKASMDSAVEWLRLPDSFDFAQKLVKQNVPLLLAR